MRKPISPAKPSTPGLKCVLLVADEDSTRLTAKWALTDFGYQVDVTRCAEEALALFDPAVHDVVVTADTMPGLTGVELAHIIKLRSRRTPVVLVTEHAAPADRSCLSAVLEKGAGVWGLTGVLQQLPAGPPKDAGSATHKSRREARRLRKLEHVSVPEGQAASSPTF
ncbi:MAG: response regulator [Limisphaerales bacterium]